MSSEILLLLVLVGDSEAVFGELTPTRRVSFQVRLRWTFFFPCDFSFDGLFGLVAFLFVSFFLFYRFNLIVNQKFCVGLLCGTETLAFLLMNSSD